MVLLQIFTEIIELLDYPMIPPLLCSPFFVYAFYMMAVKRRSPWTKTGQALFIFSFIALFLLTWIRPIKCPIEMVDAPIVLAEPLAQVGYWFAIFVLLILVSTYWERQRVAFSEVLAVTLVSFLIAGVVAAPLLLDLYTRPLPWHLTIVRLGLLMPLFSFTALAVGAVRKKVPKPKKSRLIFLVMPLIPALLSYWNTQVMVITVILVLLAVIMIVRGPD